MGGSEKELKDERAAPVCLKLKLLTQLGVICTTHRPC